MSDNDFDCIVIGSGGIGSAALWQLASRGAKVLGLEQYDIAHDKGSSHGETRAIRLVYLEHPDYVPLLQRGFALWRQLEQESGESLFLQSGILQAGIEGGHVVSGLMAAAEAHGLDMERMSATEANRRFEGFDFPESHVAIFDPNGGFLRIEACIRAFVRLAESRGARIETGTTVRNWYADATGVTVETDRARYRADKLIVTPGAWASRLLPALAPHLHLLRKSLFWFEPEDDCYLAESGLPVFLFELLERTWYGFPCIDSRGLKIAEHSGGKSMDTPESLDRHVHTDELEQVTLALKRVLPRVGHQLNHHASCMYTMSPDGHFIVGNYPGLDRVHITAGLSGHGYKFATVLGEIMADLALDGKTPHETGFLSPDRLA